MKTMKLMMMLCAVVGFAWGGPLTEATVRASLKARDEALEKGDVETIVGLYATNAAISVSFFGIPEAKETLGGREFAELFSEDLNLVTFGTEPAKIEMVDGGALVTAMTRLAHTSEGERNRVVNWRIQETLNFALIDDRPKITEERLVIEDQTLEPDELSERIMKLVRQEGGVDKETAIKLLKESGCQYREGDGANKKTIINSGFNMQCGEEIAALAVFVPGVQVLKLTVGGVTDESLVDIGTIQTLEKLYLMGPRVTDAGIDHLAKLERLESLTLMATGITDASLERIAAFPALEQLTIMGTPRVTDAGLAHLAKQETLQVLWLAITMTDAGLEHLVNIPNLVNLQIQNAPITDAGLASVEKMEKLSWLMLIQTDVTHAGAKRLKEKRPKLRISPSSLTEPCVDSRRKLEYAKKRWAEKEKKKEGAAPTRQDLEPFLKYSGGFEALTCEEGGTLTINPIGTGAECSIHGKIKAEIPKEPLEGLSKEDFDVDGAKVGRWTMDLAAAEQLAAESALPLLLNFTGSDWCYWCKLMEKNVFTKSEWNAYATNHVVMVLIDFPRDKAAVPDKYKKRNGTLKERYGITGYPTFVLLRPDGSTELGRLKAGREKTPESFIEEVKALLNTEG